MGRPRKDYRIKLQGNRAGHPFFDLIVDGKKYRLAATNQYDAATEGAVRYQEIVDERQRRRAAKAPLGPHQLLLKPECGSLREAVVAYMESDTFGLYKLATVKQRRSMLDLIMRSPASSGRHRSE